MTDALIVTYAKQVQQANDDANLSAHFTRHIYHLNAVLADRLRGYHFDQVWITKHLAESMSTYEKHCLDQWSVAASGSVPRILDPDRPFNLPEVTTPEPSEISQTLTDLQTLIDRLEAQKARITELEDKLADREKRIDQAWMIIIRAVNVLDYNLAGTKEWVNSGCDWRRDYAKTRHPDTKPKEEQ